MVKLAKNVNKPPQKLKKMAALPAKEVDDSEEEDDSSEEEESSEEEMIPQKKAATPGKAAAVTPNKKAAATPGKKATPAPTPAKKAAVTPAKKGAATPAKKTPVSAKGAKNGKNAKKEESEDEEDEDEEDEDEDSEEEDESEEEVAVPVKKPTKVPAIAKKAAVTAKVAKQVAQDDDDEEDDDEDEDEEDESEDEPMEITPAKGKKAAVLAKPTLKKATPAKVAKEESEEDDDDEEDDEDDEEDDDEEEEEEENVQETSGKRKKEMAKQKGTPDAKKQKTEAAFSVFLGNLNANKDFEELKAGIRDFFTKKDIEVQDVRLGGSKKFGYVDFPSEAEMDKALKLNGKKLMGLELKLEKAKSRESIQENKKERDARTLFVKNLPFSVSKEDLQEEFDNAVEVRLVSRDGNSKGMAYIEFKSEAEAEKTLEEKQGLEMSGRAIVIDYTGEKSQQDTRKGGKGGQSDSKTLVVNNLSYDATEESLQEVFEKASAIRIPQNNQGRPKGFAFVDFATAEDAKEAMNSCNNTEIEGRAIRLEFSTQGGQNRNQGRGGFSQQSKTLFVKGLSEDTTEETLRESFDGSVGARIVTDRETGSSKGFGFVDFSSAEDAKAAKEAMEDGEIDGNKVTLDFAKPKGDGQRGGGGGGFGRGGRGGGGRGGGRGGFGRGGGRGFGGRGGGFRGGRGGGGDHKPQGKKIKFDD
ncbi:nucleolin [Anolis carolinensis]|uniref:nucleolin n=1 Tax=Anolis carolinensis TaxID=28377 RepID=UPI000203A531|nr:PREDICTED: nucleolin [Anolis carolinensis]|eukprot:XP_003225545.1 PREDICTED: nucleolin [Anolis carolinensis]